MRIQGILLPADWNDEGQVTKLVLATHDEVEIKIETTQPPSRFAPYLRRNVIVDGDLANSGLLRIKAIGYYEVDLESVDQNSN